jgi:hypothetical protein
MIGTGHRGGDGGTSRGQAIMADTGHKSLSMVPRLGEASSWHKAQPARIANAIHTHQGWGLTEVCRKSSDGVE